MGFNRANYQMDTARRHDPDASLDDGALLYRITSDMHSDRAFILTGQGAKYREGRYHYIRQLTTYCAMSVPVALSEILFSMYRAVLDGVHAGLNAFQLDALAADTRHLVVLAVDRIDDIVYVDTLGARATYSPGLQRTAITHPDRVYTPLQEFGREVSKALKNGVVYPSARQSDDFAYALFEDQTSKLKSAPYETLEVHLQLVPEDHDFLCQLPAPAPPLLDLDRERPHPTIGHYEFADAATLAALKGQGLINPADLPESSYIDFVRRRYTSPDKKFIPCR